MDEAEGFDADNNPYAQMSEEFVTHREEQIIQKWKRKVSFHQQQKNKDVEKWETNRMLQSGVVTQVDPDEDFEEENEARVHIIVRHIVPPFLDGRITFTKQFEPVIPLKDPTSDMAVICRKGCKSVRHYREQKVGLEVLRFEKYIHRLSDVFKSFILQCSIDRNSNLRNLFSEFKDPKLKQISG